MSVPILKAGTESNAVCLSFFIKSSEVEPLSRLIGDRHALSSAKFSHLIAMVAIALLTALLLAVKPPCHLAWRRV